MGRHSVTQATALGARLPVFLAVGLGQIGAVGVLVHAGLVGGQGGVSGTGDLDTPGQYIVTTETPYLFTLNSGNDLANTAHSNTSLESDETFLSPVCAPADQ